MISYRYVYLKYLIDVFILLLNVRSSAMSDDNLSFKERLKLSMEKIGMQDGSLFNELSNAIEGLMQLTVVDQNDINQSRLAKVVKKYTGMEVNFNIIDNTYDAFCYLPEIDKNHPFWHQRNVLLCSMTKNYTTTKPEVVGSVNLKNGTVDGVFASFPVKIYFGTLFLRGLNGEASIFTADEVAAILIHEIGHAFTTFEYVGKTVMTGLIITSAVKATAEIPDSQERNKVLVKACENVNLNLSQDQIGAIIKQHGENSDVVLLTEYVKNLNTLTKTNYYDARNCEQLADQFAVQHGAADALGRALERIYKMSYNINYRGNAMYMLLEVMKISFTMLWGGAMAASLGGIGVFLVIVLLLLQSTEVKIYDDPKDRLIFLKRQLIDDLKVLNHQDKKNAVLIARLVDHIESLEMRIEEVKDRKSFAQAIWENVTPWGRNREQQEKKQKQLEEALNNDLFVKAAKLTQI